MDVGIIFANYSVHWSKGIISLQVQPLETERLFLLLIPLIQEECVESSLFSKLVLQASDSASTANIRRMPVMLDLSW